MPKSLPNCLSIQIFIIISMASRNCNGRLNNVYLLCFQLYNCLNFNAIFIYVHLLYFYNGRLKYLTNFLTGRRQSDLAALLLPADAVGGPAHERLVVRHVAGSDFDARRQAIVLWLHSGIRSYNKYYTK